MASSEEVLRRLAIGDRTFCQTLLVADQAEPSGGLDARSLALLRLGGSIAAGAGGPILRQRVSDALDVGLTFDDVVASLVALAPTIGVERLTAVAPDLAWALDYDIDAALERLDEVDQRSPAGLMPPSRPSGAH